MKIIMEAKIIKNYSKEKKQKINIYLKYFILIIFYFFFNYTIKNAKIPKIFAISYSNEKYKIQQELNKKSALEIGKADKYYGFGPNDIDPQFREKNKEILSQIRGNGYWLWKPYFILKTFKEKLKEGDYIIYTDSGILYMDSIYKIVYFLQKQKEEMWAIQLPKILLEKNWTKRDAFILLGVDEPFYTNTPQYMAGIQIYRKSTFTEKFLEDYLYYSQDKRIITDMPNTLGINNYEGFIENRHDQSVFSLLIKKYGLASSGKTNIDIITNNKQNIEMPYIFCIYRQRIFKDYKDLRNICIKYIKDEKF